MRIDPIWRWAGLISLLSGAAVSEPKFERRNVGLTHSYTGGWEHFVGGGLSAFDCDGDHLPELFAAGGEEASTLFRNRSGRGGELNFQAETPDSLALTGVTGSYPLDVDADGWQDLFILRVGANRLLRGGPDCQFSEFETLGFTSGDRWSTAFSATWERDNVLPTLAVGNYVDRTDPRGPFEACDGNRLYRPDGARYGPATDLAPGFCALSLLFSDWGRLGRADLRVSNDRHYYVRDGEEQMWAMEPDPRLYDADDGWLSHQIWGMGIASRDLTGDGLPEIYLTSMGDQVLQARKAGAKGPSYENAGFDRGATAHRPYTGGDGRPSTGWHAVFGDVQNDGLDDLFVAKGNVEQMPGLAMDDPNNLLVQQADGSFAEHGLQAGIASVERGRGAVLADLNLDGLLDLAVVNRRAPIEIYENVTDATGHHLLVKLVQDGPNRDAVGAVVELLVDGRRISREITVGGGHAGGVSGPEHFGLGKARFALLQVIWPDGAQSGQHRIEAGRAVVVTRGEGSLTIADY